MSGNDGDATGVRIIRSPRRKKTVSIRHAGEMLEVRAPADMSERELMPIVERLRRRIERRRRRQAMSDDELLARAKELERKYFHERLPLKSIRYVSNQKKRYGSCTPAEGTIRITDRLRQFPLWVLDYVIVHELAHLVHADHSALFWELVNRYPLSERARGFLMGAGVDEDLDDDGL